MPSKRENSTPRSDNSRTVVSMSGTTQPAIVKGWTDSSPTGVTRQHGAVRVQHQRERRVLQDREPEDAPVEGAGGDGVPYRDETDEVCRT